MDVGTRSAVLDRLRSEVTTEQTRATELTTRIAAVNAELDAATKGHTVERDNATKCLSALQARMADTSVNRDALATALAAVKNTRTSVGQCERAENPFMEQRVRVNADMKALQAELVDLNSKILSTSKDYQGLRFWEHAFGPKGIPAFVMSEVLPLLQSYIDWYTAQLLHGSVSCALIMTGDELHLTFQAFDDVNRLTHERTFNQLSRGQQRCLELAVSPFAISDVARHCTSTHVPLLVIDELTAHLDAHTKPQVCAMLRASHSAAVVVIDHDPSVQGEFDEVWTL
eukprot:CAMPEP_0177644970 /NCGR_PEP_ID=MMETSP0447-20121125/8992_1 /TAXON_ID=0 /ORGANISM="Stygamoeba regulata, Strain BSH-02190019" /LENGTH=285 /DNA_ID=CAMNT_0019147407 /DNA_START=1 /DNA_END=855 /DNA_ORIENTATION=-